MTSADTDVAARLVDEARSRLERCTTVDELRGAEAELVGKRSPLAATHRGLGGLPPDERRRQGQLLHQARTAVEALVAERAVSSGGAVRHAGVLDRAGVARLLASAGVAFLFSGTVQDKVYDLVDRIRGEDLDMPLGAFPPGSVTSNGESPAPDQGSQPS